MGVEDHTPPIDRRSGPLHRVAAHAHQSIPAAMRRRGIALHVYW